MAKKRTSREREWDLPAIWIRVSVEGDRGPDEPVDRIFMALEELVELRLKDFALRGTKKGGCGCE